MSALKILMLSLFFALGMSGLTGCEEPGPFERAGEEIDEAAEDADEALEDAGEEIEEAAEDLDDDLDNNP